MKIKIKSILYKPLKMKSSFLFLIFIGGYLLISTIENSLWASSYHFDLIGDIINNAGKHKAHFRITSEDGKKVYEKSLDVSVEEPEERKSYEVYIAASHDLNKTLDPSLPFPRDFRSCKKTY